MDFVNERLEEFNRYIEKKRVAVIGLGTSNIPLLDYLHDKKANVTVFDSRTIEQIPKDIMDKVTNYDFSFSFGEDNLSKLIGFNLILRSPSCMPNQPALEREAENGAIVTSEIELLLKMAPCKVIGVTGSDGKTTTTSLIYAILNHAGYNCYLGGNIGIPLFTKLPEMKPEDIVVLELSSFQLMNMEVSPDISVVTNVSPNHLNVHKSYEEYIEAKKNIFLNQSENGIVVLNYDNDITKKFAKDANGKVVFFSSKTKLEDGIIVDNNVIKECQDKVRRHLISADKIKLRGIHNYENICAAIGATSTLVDVDTIIEAVSEFSGVEHRLEFVRDIDNVKWYNDSIGTSPTRTIAGLNSFNEEIVLIAGGYDKHLDYEPLAKPIVEKVKSLVLMGQTADKIYNAVTEELERQNINLSIYKCNSLEESVQMANKIALKGQIVLFSPASASFDMFKNFEDRGNRFKEIVNSL